MEINPQVLACVMAKLADHPTARHRVLDVVDASQESETVTTLYNQVLNYLESLPPTPQRVPVKIYMPACMDITHSGHFNAMRQAKALGDYLVVGVVADAEIRRSKGPPVMTLEERAALAHACKWPDRVVEGVEYYVNMEILARVGCDFVAHGDDLPIAKDTGLDAYAEVRAAGKIKVMKRTEGVSTTQLVGKMLLMTQDEVHDSETLQASRIDPQASGFLATTRRITQFSTGRLPQPEDKVVYVDGTFDMLHIGHVQTLQRARELGDFLIVGVHSDKLANEHKGSNYPIMNLHERTLNLLALKSVDDVLMGAPWIISEDMIRSLNISVVVSGTSSKVLTDRLSGADPYEAPKRLGIFVELSSQHTLTTEDIVQRIVDNRLNYLHRNKACVAKAVEYEKNKSYVHEI